MPVWLLSKAQHLLLRFSRTPIFFLSSHDPAASNTKAHGSDMQTVVATERRSLLIKEVLDEAAFRTSVAEEVAQQRYDPITGTRDNVGVPRCSWVWEW